MSCKKRVERINLIHFRSLIKHKLVFFLLRPVLNAWHANWRSKLEFWLETNHIFLFYYLEDHLKSFMLLIMTILTPHNTVQRMNDTFLTHCCILRGKGGMVLWIGVNVAYMIHWSHTIIQTSYLMEAAVDQKLLCFAIRHLFVKWWLW